MLFRRWNNYRTTQACTHEPEGQWLKKRNHVMSSIEAVEVHREAEQA